MKEVYFFRICFFFENLGFVILEIFENVVVIILCRLIFSFFEFESFMLIILVGGE